MDVGKNIKRIRMEKNMTQKELGERLGGVTQQQIGQWENGKKYPKLNTLKKIAVALDSPLYDIVNDVINESFNNSLNEKTLKNIEHQVYQNLTLPEGINWQPIDIELVKMFKKLNEKGQEKAIERVEELTEIPRYTNKDAQQPDNKD